MSVPTIPRPTSGDVVTLILDDHRLFEALLRNLRDETADRQAALDRLSAVLIAHAEAEEREVYPSLRKQTSVDAEQVEHSEHEHDEGNQALLEVLDVGNTDSEEFGEAVEELTKALAHHLDEEERTILNPARMEVDEDVRNKLGQQFAAARSELLDADCGSLDNVRKVASRAD